MAPPVEITIPSTTTSPSPKPHTLYNITLRLPLRSFVLQKRYSDFVSLHAALSSTTPPPEPLPSKSWFKSTVSSPELTEERRAGLERYLRAIAESPDKRWRDQAAWRTFLGLPSSTGGSIRSQRQEDAKNKGMEPREWLEQMRELKDTLRDARLWLGKRDGATSAQAQFEAGAGAKRGLVKSAALVRTLEEGLRAAVEEERRGGGRLGGGEVRRRGDLLASARTELEGLEKLSISLASASSSAAPSPQTKDELFGPHVSRPPGRVLGAPIPETKKTRELDNEGVLQLQKQLMQEQDLDVEALTQVVRRQKEMGMAIHSELEVQNEMLKHVDEVATRVGGKLEVARKRVGKIS